LTPPEFRTAEARDFDLLTGIWLEAVRASHDFLTAEQIEGYRRRMPTEFLPAVPEIRIAEDETGPLGFIGMDGEAIEMLFVDPASHGRGVGRALIDLVAPGRSRLTVDVNEQNPAAHGFYLHLGFRETGRSATDPDGNPFPMVHLER